MKSLSLKTRAHQRDRFESYWHSQDLRVSSRVSQYLGMATYGLFKVISSKKETKKNVINIIQNYWYTVRNA